MISIKVKKETIPKIPLSNKERYRAEHLDMRDTVGGTSEWVQSFVASTAHKFFGKGGEGLGWVHVYKFVAEVYKFGEGIYDWEDYTEEGVTLTGDDVERYKIYLEYISYLKEDYFVEKGSCSYRDAYRGDNVRSRFFDGYIIGVDEDLVEKIIFEEGCYEY